MQDLVFVQVGAALEELFHVAFDLRLGEADIRVFEKSRQVMIHVWGHHKHAGLLACVFGAFNRHLFQLQDIDMVQLFQQFDLSQGGYGKTVLFVVHQDLFQRHNLSLLLRSRF